MVSGPLGGLPLKSAKYALVLLLEACVKYAIGNHGPLVVLLPLFLEAR